jgi:hypothetical protein
MIVNLKKAGQEFVGNRHARLARNEATMKVENNFRLCF